MRYLKRHTMHLAMCAPMVLVAIILIATGSGLAILLPLAGCMLMMSMMMGGMHGHHGSREDRGNDQRR